MPIRSYGGGAAAAGGGLNLVAEVDVATDSDAVVVSGLDGDTHEIYIVILKLVNPTGDYVDYGLQVNGDTGTNYDYAGEWYGAAGGSHWESGADRIWFGSCVAGGVAVYKLVVYAKSGIERLVESNGVDTEPTVHEHTGMWKNTVDNLTRIDIIANVAGGIGAGSKILVYALK